jgi:hypothetical protein
MATFTATGFDYILPCCRSHAGTKARGAFAFTAGAAKSTFRHNLRLECSAELAFSKKDPGSPFYSLLTAGR